jgi:transcriptional regulator with XRE-family HTH domain
MQRDRPPVLGLALSHLLMAHGWKAKELADAAGQASSTISAYQTLPGRLTRERLEELGRLMRLGAPEVERAIYTATVSLLGVPPARTPVDPTPEQHRGMVKAATMAGRETLELVYETSLREVREENAARALEEGRALATELKKWSHAERRVLVGEAPDYHHWGLAVCLCDDSIAAAADDLNEALKLAELALLVAQHVPGTDAWRSRLAGYCTGFIANAQKVANELRKAQATVAGAWRAWNAGEDEAGLHKGYLAKHLRHMTRPWHWPRRVRGAIIC